MTLDEVLGLLEGTQAELMAFVTMVLVVVGAWWLIGRMVPATRNGRMARGIARAAVLLVAALVLIVVLLDADRVGPLVSVIGLVITAVIAISSTTFVTNAMAGAMLRTIGSFRVGDFVQVGEHFGRVTESGLLHTELQTEDRDLLTLPNLLLITQPVKVVLASGTLISAEVSLGYDQHRATVRELLMTAAEAAELEEPFVQVRALGDFSVTYRVCGFLKEVSRLVSQRSALRARMLDVLHEANIEIVSPSFMNQRQVPEPVIPIRRREADLPATDAPDAPEALMFDKAEAAARLDRLAQQRDTLAVELEALRKDSELDEARRDLEIGWRERQLAMLEETLGSAGDAD